MITICIMAVEDDGFPWFIVGTIVGVMALIFIFGTIGDKRRKRNEELKNQMEQAEYERKKQEEKERYEQNKRNQLKKFEDDIKNKGYVLSVSSHLSQIDFENKKEMVLRERKGIIDDISKSLCKQHHFQGGGVIEYAYGYNYVRGIEYCFENYAWDDNIALEIVKRGGFDLDISQWVAVAMAVAEILHKKDGSVWCIEEDYDDGIVTLSKVKKEKEVKQEPFC